MKKITIFAIILMPLIACLILFMSGTIINNSTYLAVESIEFAQESVVLNKVSNQDVSLELQVNVFPMLASNKTVEFWSDNEDVVTIDKNGTITSKDFGQTYVHVRSKENSTKTASCKVVVTSDNVHRIWVENQISTMFVGDKHNLSIGYAPTDVSNVEFVFNSLNEDIVYVSPSGELIAKDKGKTTIKVALASNLEINYSFEVECKIKIQSMSADVSQVQSGASQFSFPQIDVYPADANREISYSSSDESIAVVDASGNITFLKAGEVTIIAQADGIEPIQKIYKSTMGYFTDIQFNSNSLQIDFEDYQNKNLELDWSGLPEKANKDYVSFSSDNEGVIKVQNNALKVINGGRATITLTAKKSETASIYINIVVVVNRKADSISTSFLGFQYITQKSIDLDFLVSPQGSTEQITYTLSDTSVANIDGNKLIFSQQTINNKCGKTVLTASTPSGVVKTVTFVYLDSAIRQIDIDESLNVNLIMQKTGETPISFALRTNETAGDVSFAISEGAENLVQNEYIFTIKNNGTACINVHLNNQTSVDKCVNITIQRQVEKIENIQIVAKWNDEKTETFGNPSSIYSSSKQFAFSYTLYPQNTTLTIADVQIIGDSANIIDGEVQFTKAGKITLELSADDISKQIEIESTYLHPDEQTTVCDKIDLYKGQTASIFNYINITPKNADNKFITYQTTSNFISIDENGLITAICGGETVIDVAIQTATVIINKSISVFVSEDAEDIEVVGNQYVFAESASINLSDKFNILPHTANTNLAITYSVPAKAPAFISQSGVLTFSKEGSCIVTAKLHNNNYAQICVAFVNNSIVLQGKEANFKVLSGTKVVVMPSSQALATASYNQQYVLDNTISKIDDIFIEINQDTTISFNNENYVIDCVENIQNVTIGASQSTDVDIVGKKYITGLKNIQLSGVVSGVNLSYLSTQYSVSDATIATISQTGELKFKKAGTTKISFNVKYNKDVVCADKQEKTVTFDLESTFGFINRISVVDELSHVIDDENLDNNKANIDKYIKAYPTQIALSEDVIRLESNSQAIAINQLELQFIKGGKANVEVWLNSEQGFAVCQTLQFDVKKYATDLYLNGQKLQDGQIIDVGRSTTFISLMAYPTDANLNCQVEWQVIENNYGAIIDDNRITFKQVDKPLLIKFALGKEENYKEYLVTFKTSIITFEVDIDADTFVVPMEEPFTFIASNPIENLQVEFDETFSQVEYLENDIFIINQSNVGRVNISYNGTTKTINLVATINISSIDNVKLRDTNINGTLKDIETDEGNLSLITASTLVELYYDIPVGYDKYGNLVKYTISTSNNNIATISEDKKHIKFLSQGTVNITISISFEDAYGQKNISYSFSIQSTCGNVTEFSITKTSYNMVYDTLTSADIDIESTITRVAPLYGRVDAKTINSKNANVVEILDGVAQICGSGSAIIEVSWGRVSKTIEVIVDKWIDKINFVENDKVISQIVIKSDKYKLNYIFTALDDNFYETLKDVRFETSDNCTVENGELILDGENQEYMVTIKAVNGNAQSTLIVTRVGENTNIIDVDSNTSSIVIHKDEVNIFNYYFNEDIVKIAQIDDSISFANPSLQTFKGLYGSQGNISLDNKQVINYIVTEDVQEIRLKDEAPQENYLTAMGDSDNAIDLAQVYGAWIYPETARNQDGKYQVEYSVSNAMTRSAEAIAYILDNKLYFTAPGKVVITFSAGDVQIARTIESTMGYAQNIEFASSDELIFEFVENLFEIPANFYNVYPANAYKANVKLTSENSDIFTIENNKMAFVGGGKTYLNLTYSLDENTTKTIKKAVYIKNRAQDINFYDGEYQVAYMVKDITDNPEIVLDYKLIYLGKQLSDYNIVLESSNKHVATISDDGIIKFNGVGETIITVKVQEKSNADNSETQNIYDAVAQLNLVARQGYKIYKLTTDSQLTIEFDDNMPYILYPIAETPVSNFNFDCQDNQVLEINQYGEITKYMGGNATIKVSAKGGEEICQLNIYVHRKANISLNIADIYKDSDYDIYTSKTQFDILPATSITTEDALINKTVSYASSDTSVAEINGHIIEFKKAGYVTVTISIEYNGQEETSKSFTIYSSFNQVENFDITSSAELTNGAYLLYVGDDPIEFDIKNIKPKDYSAQIANMFFTSSNSNSFTTLATSSTSFKLSPTRSGTGNFTFRYDSESSAVYKNFNVEIKQWSTAVEIQYNNQRINSLTILENKIDLTAIVGPSDATIKTVMWEIEDNSIAQLSQTETNKARIEFSNIGTIIVTARATDGKSLAFVTIEYKDLDGFKITTSQAVGEDGQYKSITVEENQDIPTAYLNWNQTSITFKIIALIDGQETALTNFSNFAISTQKNVSATIDNAGYFTIYTASIQDSPIYEDIITVSYSSIYEGNVSIKIYRDGLQAIDFGDHNEVKDAECGLQQMRVYGNKSYYGGMQTYYTMNVNITNNNAVVLADNANSTNFVNQIVWETTTNSGVTITDKNQGVGYVNIDFASVPSSYINSFDSIYNFDGKTTDSLSTITVYAKNKAGRVLAQYTFIVVDGVNIFDQDGYLNAGNNIVLQKSFGHNDQQSQIDNGKYVKLESYVAKDTIYGNGHLINFDYHNNDADSLQSGGVTGISSWAHVAVSIANAVNLKIQGSNYDESRESYLIELASPQNIAYCEMYNMLRAIELGGNATVNIRKSLFRSFKEAGIVATNEGSRTINLEDVIMFDVGQRAIEVQGVGDKVYVSGFLDVYNYQNKTALKEAIGSVDYVTNISGQIIDAAKSNNMSVNRLNEDWANVICIGVKDAVNRSDIMNSRNQDGSVSVGVPNIEKVYGEYTTGIFNKKTTTYYAWATTNDHPDISWDKEYLENGELNYAVLISTSSKVSRLGGQIEDIE